MDTHPFSRSKQKGFTLVELVIMIVVLGIAAVTLTMISARSGEMSAQMIRDQQALDLATSVLNEVRSMPFTYCDPVLDAGDLGTAVSSGGCPLMPESMGPEAGQSRLGNWAAGTRYNNVNDYNGLSLSGASLKDFMGNSLSAVMPTLASCVVNVSVVAIAFAGITVASNEAQRITVQVSGCDGQSGPISLQTIRVRYAPNSL